MIDHKVAQAPPSPITIGIAYTEHSQKTNVEAIILSEAFKRCLDDLGQYEQLRLMINVADCYSNQKVFVRMPPMSIAAQPIEFCVQDIPGNQFATS